MKKQCFDFANTWPVSSESTRHNRLYLHYKITFSIFKWSSCLHQAKRQTIWNPFKVNMPRHLQFHQRATEELGATEWLEPTLHTDLEGLDEQNVYCLYLLTWISSSVWHPFVFSKWHIAESAESNPRPPNIAGCCCSSCGESPREVSCRYSWCL